MGSFFWLIVLAILWGPTFFFNKMASAEIPVFTLTAMRVGLAALLLLVVVRLRKLPLPTGQQAWKHLFAMALLTNVIPFTCFALGSTRIDVSLGAVLAGCTPLFTAILAQTFLPHEPLSRRNLAGLLLGLTGIFVLFAPGLLNGRSHSDSVGILIVLAAVFSNACGFIYARTFMKGASSLSGVACKLLISTVILVPVALANDPLSSIAYPSLFALSAATSNAVFGTALAFLVYYHLVERESATYVASVNYLLPLIGIILGISVLGEQVTWNFAAGGLAILSGVSLATHIERPTTQGRRL